MLNVRAETHEEFKASLDALSATDILGDLSGINATIKALDAVEQAGLQPSVVTPQPVAVAPAQPTAPVVQPDAAISAQGVVTPLQQYQNGVATPAQPQATPQPAFSQQISEAVTALPSCIHGVKNVISKQKADGVRWFAYACNAQQGDPSKCGLDFPGFNGADMPQAHKAQAKYLS